MRYLILSFFICACSSLKAQNRFGLQAGVSSTFWGVHSSDYNIHEASRPCFTAEANYMRKVSRHAYLGAKLLLEPYDYSYGHTTTTHVRYSQGNADVRATYLSLAPTVDLGIGLRQYVHFYLAAAAGLRLNGYALVHERSQDVTNYTLSATDTNYSTAVNNFVFHIYFGIEEQVRIDRQWRIVFNEGVSLGNTNMAILHDPAKSIHPGSAYVKVGILRKYRKSVPRQVEEEVPETMPTDN